MKRIKCMFMGVCFVLLILACHTRQMHISYHTIVELDINPNEFEIHARLNVRKQTLSQTLKRAEYVRQKFLSIANNFCSTQGSYSDCSVGQMQQHNLEITPLYKVTRGKMNPSSNFKIKVDFSIESNLVVKITKSDKNFDDLYENLQRLKPQIQLLMISRALKDVIFIQYGQETEMNSKGLKQGVKRGEERCKDLNGKLKSIIKIEELMPADFFEQQEENADKQYQEAEDEYDSEQESESEEQEEQEEQTQKNLTEWKFDVICDVQQKENQSSELNF